jgi:hypothetical protein
VVTERWHCWNPEHSHRTEEAAARCTAGYKNAERRRAEKPKEPKYSQEAMEGIRFMREKGLSFTAIGARLVLSRWRVAQLYERAETAHAKRMRIEQCLIPLLRSLCSNDKAQGSAAGGASPGATGSAATEEEASD